MSFVTRSARYAQRRMAAYSDAEASLKERTDFPFKLGPMTTHTDDAWRIQWLAESNRIPPEGGWDWPKVRREKAFARKADHFNVAVWVLDDRLAGLAIGCCTGQAVEIHALEGDPRDDNPLKGQVLSVILEAATCYAQRMNKKQLWLRDPANDSLVTLYRVAYGFELTEPKGRPRYCWRQV